MLCLGICPAKNQINKQSRFAFSDNFWTNLCEFDSLCFAISVQFVLHKNTETAAEVAEQSAQVSGSIGSCSLTQQGAIEGLAIEWLSGCPYLSGVKHLCTVGPYSNWILPRIIHINTHRINLSMCFEYTIFSRTISNWFFKYSPWSIHGWKLQLDQHCHLSRGAFRILEK